MSRTPTAHAVSLQPRNHMTASFLHVEGLVKHYEQPRTLAEKLLGKPKRIVHAVNGVSLQIARGETVGLIGESGCGKSTLGRSVLRLHEPNAGQVHFDGIDVIQQSMQDMTRLRARMQIIFQDPYASLNPRKTVRDIVSLPLAIQGQVDGAERREQVQAMLNRVGLRADQFDRYPHQFSGGQRQRVGIARALVSRPALVVCDGPVSALDVSIKAQILELLAELRTEFALTYLFISHDIGVVAHLADRIAVMYMGEIVETGSTRELMRSPQHPYTQALMSAVPRIHAAGRSQRIMLKGDLPSPLEPPAGCKFHTRCPSAMPRCAQQAPPRTLSAASKEHMVSCWLHEESR